MAVSALTLFFDDARNEVGNKLSLMGLYAGDLILPHAELHRLPKLVAFTLVRWPMRSQAPRSLVLRAALPGGRKAELPADPAELSRISLPQDGNPRWAHFQGVMSFEHLPVASGDRISVHAVINGRARLSGLLTVRGAPSRPPASQPAK